MGIESVATLLMFIMILDKVIFPLIAKRKRKGRTTAPKSNLKIYTSGSYLNAYHAVPLLTNREQKEYQKLRQYAQEKNVLICPKVRLLDLVTPKPGSKNYKALLSKVMSKHVDFVICNQNMQVLGIIELDDTTHLRKDRIERDEFVDTVLKGAGYRIVHTWEICPEDLNKAIGESAVEIRIDTIISPTGWIWNEHTKLWEPPSDLK